MVKIIAGLMGSSVASGSANLSGPEQLSSLLAMLARHGVSDLDTARVYNAGKSEEDLGNVADEDLKGRFEIGTKAPGFAPGSLSFEKVISNCEASLRALKQDKIDLFYFHGPDRQTPLEESCRAIQELHQRGKIARFGISNFNRDEVEEIYTTCKGNGWILPTVYQGGFNALGRTAETELFPTLRKLDMAFYGFSPLAGGYFSRPADQLRSPPAGGRMDKMKHFSTMYVNDLTLKLHDTLTEACEKEGLELKEATLRFLVHHSALGSGDGIILGASSQEQMDENLKACEGDRLPESVVAAFEDLWVQYRKAGYNPPYCV